MKVALIENYGADFVGARLRFANFLKNKGIEVVAIIPEDGHKSVVESFGIRVIEVGNNIRAKGVKSKLNYAFELKRILKNENFDIIHCYRLQPNIIGTLISGLCTNAKIVNHVTGLGISFTNKRLKSRMFQWLIKSLYKLNNYFFKPFTIFQNKEDIIELGLKKRVCCIKGSAVNEDKFNPQVAKIKKEEINILKKELKIPLASKCRILVFVSRLLNEKGINELIQATIEINKLIEDPVFLILVGWSDGQNPSAINPHELKEIEKKYEFIKFLGKRSDIDTIIALGDLSILPTYYREGTPRFLLEAMAMGKPIITTNMPGCNHLVPDGKNGFLIKPRDVNAIVQGVLEVFNKDLEVLGYNSHVVYNKFFCEKKVYSAIYDLYTSILV